MITFLNSDFLFFILFLIYLISFHPYVFLFFLLLFLLYTLSLSLSLPPPPFFYFLFLPHLRTFQQLSFSLLLLLFSSSLALFFFFTWFQNIRPQRSLDRSSSSQSSWPNLEPSLIFVPNAVRMGQMASVFFFFFVMIWLILKLRFWVCILIIWLCLREKKKSRRERKNWYNSSWYNFLIKKIQLLIYSSPLDLMSYCSWAKKNLGFRESIGDLFFGLILYYREYFAFSYIVGDVLIVFIIYMSSLEIYKLRIIVTNFICLPLKFEPME